jgi:hypothetical protein
MTTTIKPLTGLFLGAGASCEAGMPLVWELTSEITNWLTPAKLRSLNEGWRTQGNGFSDEVINDLVKMLEQRPAVHYEATLGHLEVQFRRQRDPKLAQEYHGLYSWLVELVSHLLYYRQVNNPSFFQNALPYYDGLRSLADANLPLWVFTLNHDLIVELIAARLSIPIHSGFSDTTISFPVRNRVGTIVRHLRGELLSQHDLEHHAMYCWPPKAGINLIKVHGALDVFTFNDGKDLVRLLPETPTESAIIQMLRDANEGLYYSISGSLGGRAGALNEIAYADDQGVMQFLRRSLLAGAFKFDPRRDQVLPKSMLKHFRENVNFVTNLICLGYGFGDIHINTVLRDWLELTSQRTLVIVNPGEQALPSFLSHLAPQVTLVKSTATDYFDHVAGIVRSPKDKLSKRIGTHLRSIGRQRAGEKMASFARTNNELLSKAVLAKLEQLPKVDGKPDFSSIGDPSELGRIWASELKPTEEQLFERLLQHLEQEGSNPTL